MYHGPTEALDWLLERINLTLIPNINSQTFWPEVISYFICLTPATSALLAASRIPAWWAAPKRWRRGCRNRRKKNCGKITNLQRRTCLLMIRLIREESDCIQKPGWTHSYRETWKQDEKNSKSDAASSSQVKLQVAYFGGLMKKVAGKLVATDEKIRNCGSFPNLKPGVFMKMK